MNKYRMIYIVPDQSMVESTEKVLQEEDLNIVVKQGVLQSGVDLVRDYLPQGLEVVIARAGTLRAIQEAKLGVALVELPITAFDLVYAVEKAKAYGTRIAVVSYQFMVLGLETVSNYLGVDIEFFYIQNREEADATIATAFAQGYDVVIGGKVTADAARAHKMPYVFIESSRASILQAAYEAKRTAQTVENEKYKRELFSAVVDYANDGIMTVDTSGVITSMNPKAVQITTFKRAVGYNINSLWPGLALDQVIENNIQQLGQILDLNGVQVVCNKVPIIVNGRSVGAVVNFQEITKIQQLEASIRREIYSKGHVARFSFSDILGSTY
ncbi:MAG: PrpR N-terminal domain-containing protein [Negativicutes bacterium]